LYGTAGLPAGGGGVYARRGRLMEDAMANAVSETISATRCFGGT